MTRRELTWVGVLQVGLLTAGWLAAAVCLRHGPARYLGVEAPWFRQHGLWLMALPPVWTGLAVFLHTVRPRGLLTRAVAAAGPLIALGLLALALDAAATGLSW